MIDKLLNDAYVDRGPGQISRLQWSILRCLARATPEQKTPTWIARFVGLTLAPVTRALDSLNRRGLIVRTKSASDGRQTTVSLTGSGRQILDLDPLKSLAALISRLPEDQKNQFKQTLQTISIQGILDG
ncbi:MarR family transcriptional regulator [Roseibium sp.]|uniref:MarR family transcriptional regulator n=1 Tax=Roseibium sp. TaxID=1936156 RepID=UPI003BAA19EB